MSQTAMNELLAKLNSLLPTLPAAPDFASVKAMRWIRRPTLLGHVSYLEPVTHFAEIRFADLQHIERQKELIAQNTRQFLAKKPANNVLMTGARGTGKSSLVRACLSEFHSQGLRVVEVEKQDLMDLPRIVEMVSKAPYRFILFCDDLSFESGDAGYKALKSVLDGSVAAQSENLLIYATSNRRHLMPEHMSENLETRYEASGEIHPGETVEEKVSLSERFGLWVSFHSFNQQDYLDIVTHWLAHFGCTPALIDEARQPALQWALERGSRSGRVALHFARDWAGRH
ncbi:MAG: ATP-binding protein [Burkholderiaceae bacterium]|nr:ATP-binding protein [Burkholderiaceae bacterium]